MQTKKFYMLNCWQIAHMIVDVTAAKLVGGMRRNRGCTNERSELCARARAPRAQIYINVYIYMCVYVFVYTYICIYILYIYICTYTCIYIHLYEYIYKCLHILEIRFIYI